MTSKRDLDLLPHAIVFADEIISSKPGACNPKKTSPPFPCRAAAHNYLVDRGWTDPSIADPWSDEWWDKYKVDGDPTTRQYAIIVPVEQIDINEY